MINNFFWLLNNFLAIIGVIFLLSVLITIFLGIMWLVLDIAYFMVEKVWDLRQMTYRKIMSFIRTLNKTKERRK
jgi:hypothetical protein